MLIPGVITAIHNNLKYCPNLTNCPFHFFFFNLFLSWVRLDLHTCILKHMEKKLVIGWTEKELICCELWFSSDIWLIHHCFENHPCTNTRPWQNTWLWGTEPRRSRTFSAWARFWHFDWPSQDWTKCRYSSKDTLKFMYIYWCDWANKCFLCFQLVILTLSVSDGCSNAPKCGCVCFTASVITCLSVFLNLFCRDLIRHVSVNISSYRPNDILVRSWLKLLLWLIFTDVGMFFKKHISTINHFVKNTCDKRTLPPPNVRLSAHLSCFFFFCVRLANSSPTKIIRCSKWTSFANQTIPIFFKKWLTLASVIQLLIYHASLKLIVIVLSQL